MHWKTVAFSALVAAAVVIAFGKVSFLRSLAAPSA